MATGCAYKYMYIHSSMFHEMCMSRLGMSTLGNSSSAGMAWQSWWVSTGDCMRTVGPSSTTYVHMRSTSLI